MKTSLSTIVATHTIYHMTKLLYHIFINIFFKYNQGSNKCGFKFDGIIKWNRWVEHFAIILFCWNLWSSDIVWCIRLSNFLESILEFLIDNIFVEFVGHIFQSSSSIWKQSVLHTLPIFSYAPMRLHLYKKLSQIKNLKKTQQVQPLISLSGKLMMFCQLIIKTLLIGFH